MEMDIQGDGEAKGVESMMLLHQAARDNDVERTVAMLAEAEGAGPVMVADEAGRLPLHWALVCGNEEVASVLMAHSVSTQDVLEAKDSLGCTALHYAARGGHTDLARILLQRGCFINALDCNGRTPLHFAAQHVRPDIVELLVSRGADRGIADSYGALPCDVAATWGSYAVLDCLWPHSRPHDRCTHHHSSPSDSNPSSAGKPSIDELLNVCRIGEREAGQRLEAQAEATRNATARLQLALEEWRDAEHCTARTRKADLAGSSSKEAATALSAVRQEDEETKEATENKNNSQCTPSDTESDYDSMHEAQVPSMADFSPPSGSIEGGAAASDAWADAWWCTEWEAPFSNYSRNGELFYWDDENFAARERKPRNQTQQTGQAWLQVLGDGHKGMQDSPVAAV